MNSDHQPAVHHFLDLSTAHLKPEDNDLLGRWANDPASPVTVIRYEYGFKVLVSLDEEHQRILKACQKSGASKELLEIMRYARANGCWFINFDRDATAQDCFPTFDW